MKVRTKVIIAIILTVCGIAILPCFAIMIGQWSIGLAFICLFAVNPLLALLLGLIAGTDLRKLWWLPLAMAVTFPLLFSVAIAEIVVELYHYSVLYLLVGLFSMFLLHLLKRGSKKKKTKRRFDRRGFDHNRIHKNGTKYDDFGFDFDGYSASGYNQQGYNRNGKNTEGKYNRFYDTKSQEEEGFYNPLVYPVALTTHARERFAERIGIYNDRTMNEMTYAAYAHGKSKRHIRKTSAYLVEEIEREHENGILLIYKNYVYVFSRENVLITIYKNDKIPL